MPNYKLTYFDARARGEPIRMLFELVGQKYEEDLYDFEGQEWPKIKGDTKRFPLGQLPVLDVDGKLYIQSQSIYRYICRTFPGDYYGKNTEECARIDEILGIVADLEIAENPAFETPDAVKREADLVKDRDTNLKFLYGFLSGSIEKAGGKHFVGNRLTLADIVVYNVMDFYVNSTLGLKGYFDPYPNLLKFYESFKNDSPLTPYIKARTFTKY